MLSEIINVFLGQCGVQMANACWELFCVEHGIGPDGVPVFLPSMGDAQGGCACESDDSVDDRHCFFNASVEGRYTPRTVLLDTEPTVIDEIRSGVYRNLFDRRSLISGKEDGASNYARGFYRLAPEYRETFEDSMRFIAESCDNLDGIQFFHSYGGGTGAGVLMALEEGIDVNFPKETKIDIGLYPSRQQATSVVEPYNAVLSSCCPTRFEAISLIFDNHAIINVIRTHLDIECISFSHMNRLVAQVISGLTANWRFDSLLSARLTELQTNLIPFPGMRFLQCSLAPIISTCNPDAPAVGYDSLLAQCLSDDNQLARSEFSLDDSLFMACALLYRGTASAATVNASVDDARRQGKLNFADWSPCGYKIGICNQPMTAIAASGMLSAPLSLVALFNCTAVRGCLNSIHQQYEILKKHKAFYHWYLAEGLEESEFDRCGEEFGGLMVDYEDMSKSTRGSSPARVRSTTSRDSQSTVANGKTGAELTSAMRRSSSAEERIKAIQRKKAAKSRGADKGKQSPNKGKISPDKSEKHLTINDNSTGGNNSLNRSGTPSAFSGSRLNIHSSGRTVGSGGKQSTTVRSSALREIDEGEVITVEATVTFTAPPSGQLNEEEDARTIRDESSNAVSKEKSTKKNLFTSPASANSSRSKTETSTPTLPPASKNDDSTSHTNAEKNSPPPIVKSICDAVSTLNETITHPVALLVAMDPRQAKDTTCPTPVTNRPCDDSPQPQVHECRPCTPQPECPQSPVPPECRPCTPQPECPQSPVPECRPCTPQPECRQSPVPEYRPCTPQLGCRKSTYSEMKMIPMCKHRKNALAAMNSTSSKCRRKSNNGLFGDACDIPKKVAPICEQAGLPTDNCGSLPIGGRACSPTNYSGSLCANPQQAMQAMCTFPRPALCNPPGQDTPGNCCKQPAPASQQCPPCPVPTPLPCPVPSPPPCPPVECCKPSCTSPPPCPPADCRKPATQQCPPPALPPCTPAQSHKQALCENGKLAKWAVQEVVACPPGPPSAMECQQVMVCETAPVCCPEGSESLVALAPQCSGSENSLYSNEKVMVAFVSVKPEPIGGRRGDQDAARSKGEPNKIKSSMFGCFTGSCKADAKDANKDKPVSKQPNKATASSPSKESAIIPNKEKVFKEPNKATASSPSKESAIIPNKEKVFKNVPATRDTPVTDHGTQSLRFTISTTETEETTQTTSTVTSKGRSYRLSSMAKGGGPLLSSDVAVQSNVDLDVEETEDQGSKTIKLTPVSQSPGESKISVAFTTQTTMRKESQCTMPRESQCTIPKESQCTTPWSAQPPMPWSAQPSMPWSAQPSMPWSAQPSMASPRSPAEVQFTMPKESQITVELSTQTSRDSGYLNGRSGGGGLSGRSVSEAGTQSVNGDEQKKNTGCCAYCCCGKKATNKSLNPEQRPTKRSEVILYPRSFIPRKDERPQPGRPLMTRRPSTPQSQRRSTGASTDATMRRSSSAGRRSTTGDEPKTEEKPTGCCGRKSPNQPSGAKRTSVSSGRTQSARSSGSRSRRSSASHSARSSSRPRTPRRRAASASQSQPETARPSDAASTDSALKSRQGSYAGRTSTKGDAVKDAEKPTGCCGKCCNKKPQEGTRPSSAQSVRSSGARSSRQSMSKSTRGSSPARVRSTTSRDSQSTVSQGPRLSNRTSTDSGMSDASVREAGVKSVYGDNRKRSSGGSRASTESGATTGTDKHSNTEETTPPKKKGCWRGFGGSSKAKTAPVPNPAKKPSAANVRTSQTPSITSEQSSGKVKVSVQFNVSSARNSLNEEPSHSSSSASSSVPTILGKILKEPLRNTVRSFRLMQGVPDYLSLPRTPPCSVERRNYNTPSFLEVPHNSRASSPNSSSAEISAPPSYSDISLRFSKKTGGQSSENSPINADRAKNLDAEPIGLSLQRDTPVKTFKLTRTTVDTVGKAGSSKLQLKFPAQEAVELEHIETKSIETASSSKQEIVELENIGTKSAERASSPRLKLNICEQDSYQTVEFEHIEIKPAEKASPRRLKLTISEQDAAELENTETKPVGKPEDTEAKSEMPSALATEQHTGDTPPQVLPRGTKFLGNYRNLETLLKYHRFPNES